MLLIRFTLILLLGAALLPLTSNDAKASFFGRGYTKVPHSHKRSNHHIYLLKSKDNPVFADKSMIEALGKKWPDIGFTIDNQDIKLSRWFDIIPIEQILRKHGVPKKPEGLEEVKQLLSTHQTWDDDEILKFFPKLGEYPTAQERLQKIKFRFTRDEPISVIRLKKSLYLADDGHHRLQALQDAGYTHVPVLVTEFAPRFPEHMEAILVHDHLFGLGPQKPLAPQYLKKVSVPETIQEHALDEAIALKAGELFATQGMDAPLLKSNLLKTVHIPEKQLEMANDHADDIISRVREAISP